MNYFLEVTILPDPEFPATLLMNVLFSKLHRAFVEIASERIGVSFPDAKTNGSTLGSRLRLHGSKTDLEGLMAKNWLLGMNDHLNLSQLAQVPASASHRIVRRVQVKSSPERLRRRLARRHGISIEETLARLPDFMAERTNLPFVILRSQSTGQQFRLFINQGPLQAEAKPGAFTCYGLSQQATVPWF